MIMQAIQVKIMPQEYQTDDVSYNSDDQHEMEMTLLNEIYKLDSDKQTEHLKDRFFKVLNNWHNER